MVHKRFVNGSIGTVHRIICSDYPPSALPSDAICVFPGYTGPPFVQGVPNSGPYHLCPAHVNRSIARLCFGILYLLGCQCKLATSLCYMLKAVMCFEVFRTTLLMFCAIYSIWYALLGGEAFFFCVGTNTIYSVFSYLLLFKCYRPHLRLLTPR